MIPLGSKPSFTMGSDGLSDLRRSYDSAMRNPRILAYVTVAVLSLFGMTGCVPLGSVIEDALPSGSVSWDEAPQHSGTEQTVCGPVASTGNSDNDYFVNLGHAYPDDRRFQFVLWDVGGLPPIVPGDVVCASGLIAPFEQVFEMELYSVDELTINP